MMGRARHLLTAAGACALAVALLALLAAGCGSSGTGSSSDEATGAGQAPPGATARTCAAPAHGAAELRATGVACSLAGEVAGGWTAEAGCVPAPSASRTSCTVGRYRCLAVSTGRGFAVSCARPGRSISFVARR
jgi:hypothetical protein